MIVFHIDANSAYLSWSAAALLERGGSLDLRAMPAVVGGSQASRHGIVLARSIPAKKYGVKTGESLFEARQKYPDLLVVPPDYDLYMNCSDAMYAILKRYSPLIQRYSIDECFLDYTASESRWGDPLQAAHRIRTQIREELGFTVNVGVSSNKLLAKMASELEKPDQVHTMFPGEVETKMWPLPVSELFMVGRATAARLASINVRTIGELAAMDRQQLRAMFKSPGERIWQYANGIDPSPVERNEQIIQKGIGNSMTVFYDVTDRREILAYLLSLCERTAARLRNLKARASRVSVWIRTDEFISRQHQRQLPYYTDQTSEIYRTASSLMDECWLGEPLRQMGVGLGSLARDDQEQCSFFESAKLSRDRAADLWIDRIRQRYGDGAVMRGVFANTTLKPMEGGVNEGQFLTMGGYGP
jgi:DNA polymerase-4